MTGDTKYSELAGDETVMEITLQAQWKEAEPTETPEPPPRHRNLQRRRNPPTDRIPRRSRAAQESPDQEGGTGTGGSAATGDGSPLAASGAALGLGAAAAAVLMAYRRRAKPLKTE